MTKDDSRALIARIVAGVSQQDIAALMREYADDCVLESPTAGGEVRGAPAIERVFRTWFSAFPNLEYKTERIIVDEDDIVVIALLTGRDDGGFMGLTPSHKSFRIPLVAIFTIRDGRIVRERRILDFTGFLVQIGVLKAKPA